MPVSDLIEYGWIEFTIESTKPANSTDLVRRLRKYFEVIRLGMLREPLIPRIACKKLNRMDEDDCAMLAWVQKANLETREVKTGSIDIPAIEQFIPELVLLIQREGFNAYSEIASILAKCGVALVCLPAFKNFLVHGATFTDGSRIVIGLTEKEDMHEKFGLYLLHELDHVINGDLKKPDGTTEEDEIRADEFAERLLW